MELKKIFLIIGMAAVVSNAGCGYDCERSKINALERIATSLERIATSMEKQQIQAQKDATPKKQEITNMDNNKINQCIDDCKIRFSLYSEKVDCIKRYCEENQ